MDTTRTAHVTRTRLAAITTVLAGCLLTFTACGGMGGPRFDGTYLSDESSNLETLVINGNKVTYSEMRCGNRDDYAEASAGELNEEQTSITWIETGRFEETDTVTMTESTINLGGSAVFAREDSEAGKGIRREFEERCTR